MFIWLSISSTLSFAGIVVIISPAIENETVTPREIANIFLGKANKLPSGIKVTPIDQEEGEDSRTEFYNKVAKKSPSQLNAYWSRLIFTGKGQPPKVVLDDDEVIETINTDNHLIGYASSESVDDSVTVLLRID